MEQNSLEQLRLLSDKIQEEELSIIINQMAEVLIHGENKEKSPKDLRKETEREKCASILLRSMRIHLCLDLIRQGHSSCAAQFRQDWDEIIDCIKFMEYEWNVTNEVLCDAVDVILLLDPSKRKELLRQLDFSTRRKIKPRKPLRYPVVDCAFQMIVYCAGTERFNELLRIADSLISLSEERNAADPDKHRAITARGLYYIVDLNHQRTVQICDAQRRYYEGIVSRSACRFWWFYAFARMCLGLGEETVPMMKHCYELYMEVEGETSWTGARAGSLYRYHALAFEDSREAEDYLWDSLRKIDSGFYAGMDDTADFVAANTRYWLLKVRLDKQTLKGLLPEIERFRDYCAAVEDTNKNPNLTVRHAENMLAAYYLETGDYLQAADHSLNALHSIPPDGLPREPSDVYMYSNLLLIYINLNDDERISHYMQKLIDLSGEYEDDDYLMSRVALLFDTVARKMNFQSDDLEDDRACLLDFYHDISEHEIEPSGSSFENVTLAQWILEMCSRVLDSFTADRKELLRIRKIVAYFLDRSAVYKFNDVQKCTAYTLLTQIEWQLGSDKALDHLKKCLYYGDSLARSREVHITILRFAAVVYYNYHRLEQSRAVVDEVLSGVTSAWQKATAYLNDKRICQLLSFIQRDFGICFAILRTCAAAEELYERVLQFKDLPALVGRERNKLLRLAPVDEQLKAQIFAKQDQLAAAELNDSLNGTETAKDIAAQLEHLEAQFAAQFPQNLYFTEISFRRVCEKLPDRSAIAEYYFSVSDTALSGAPTDERDALELDIFVTAKRNGDARLEHIKLERGDIILEQAAGFIGILQDPENIASAGEKEELRRGLYHKLIAPILPFLDGITELYLAPDDQLCNLPFEILHADGSGVLQDKFKVCRLVCGRDLLFYDDNVPSGGNCFILGDPNYESERGEISNDYTRSARISLEPVAELPFSGIEAARVGRHCRSRIYSDNAATKYALQEALPCSIIHLATHGVFDEEMETDSLYSSHLVFAGYNKWVTNKTESEYCGNGVLTADEISRMDLKKTELVVLSACQSGLGDTSYGSVRGLLSAFSAAGARWVVSHMWSANDFATAILMDAFYDALQNKGYDVPDALRYAKYYLKNATIRTLHRNGWLDLPDNGRFSKVTIREAEDLQRWPQDHKPFEDEYFWGGFTVHKSR